MVCFSPVGYNVQCVADISSISPSLEQTAIA